MGIRRAEITPKIVSEGLRFNMDPGNRACYPGTGTTTTDTIGNNVGTLSTTPLLSDSNFGVWELDGTDDKITLSADITFPAAFTISFWINPDTLNQELLLGDGSSSNNWIELTSATSFRIKLKSTTTTFTESGGNYFTTSNWQNAVIIRDSSNNLTAYRNTNIFGSTQTNSVTDSTYSTIGNRGPRWFDGKMGPIQTYNRALSAEEILYNYNGLRGRFGV